MSPPERQLATRPFAGEGDPEYLFPVVTSENRPFFEGLDEGVLVARRCSECSRPRFPAGPVCPYCGSTASTWERLSGRGVVHAWTRYHRAFVPEFAPLLPYSVVVVSLEAGPRMIGRLVGEWPAAIGMPVQAVAERWPGGRHVLAFEAADERRGTEG